VFVEPYENSEKKPTLDFSQDMAKTTKADIREFVEAVWLWTINKS
jgi:hypothetical protein